MTRSVKVALAITAAVVACVISLCGVALALRDWVPGLAGCPDLTRSPKTAVFTEKARIEILYPQLRPILSVHWQEHEARARSCPQIGAMDYEMNGFALITAERAAAAPEGHAAPAPDVPADLRQFAPPAPQWVDVGGGLLLDRASATVYFTRISSQPSSSPGPSWRPSSSSPAPPSSPPPS
ncbi:hypothetical protein [Dactylosporangium matsuzakiense]|uniref:Uncharacterized protein n=1 Tax=Dactylosporangium matsuzakiense TaxID=53360 RepID=A0A9W6KGJ7_9ACTN|nr:hypothetical protein [Dactylosporangium matsuzakiense]UWZ45520.1 hypothetical protein Dmats_03025 [Dactylosporangium matsuzakiense]GLL00487.1 hypothetical protein GCM10017581_022270 [Dactylosporangium matsuzakiense]